MICERSPGVIPAPAAMSRSLAENVMLEKLGEQYGDAPKSEKDILQTRTRNELRLRYVRADQKGDAKALDDVEKDMETAYDSGVITTRDLRSIRQGFSKDLTQRLFSNLKLSPQDAIGIFNQLMLPDERIAVKNELIKKMSLISKLPLTETEKEMLLDRYQRAIDATPDKP